MLTNVSLRYLQTFYFLHVYKVYKHYIYVFVFVPTKQNVKLYYIEPLLSNKYVVAATTQTP